MISWCGLSINTSSIARTGLASPTVPSTSAPISAEADDRRVHSPAGDRPRLAFGPRGVVVGMGSRHEQRELAGTGDHPSPHGLQQLVTTRRLVGDDEDPTWLHGDHLL